MQAIIKHPDKFASETRTVLNKMQREREKLRAWLVDSRPELQVCMQQHWARLTYVQVCTLRHDDGAAVQWLGAMNYCAIPIISFDLQKHVCRSRCMLQLR